MIDFCARTDIGLKRKKNDDCFLTIVDPSSGLDTSSMGSMFAVADGMGGHPAGDVASRIACEGIRDHYYDVSKLKGYLYGSSSLVSCKPLLNHLIRAFKEANSKVCFFECNNKQCEGLGTTLSVLVLRGDRAIIGHVGDSRIYRWRGGQLKLLTRDHTFVQDLLDYGDITEEEARVNPLRHVLMQSVGQGFEEVYSTCEKLEPGDMFLLCSDGLHDMITEDEIADVLRSNISVHSMCDILIERALSAGGKDNVTVIVVKYESG
ncbi:MAG: serine/threonine protein phosphatase [Thermodesulfatator sp.]|nr:MAG: serine/threonine protein phosphatase [Thermodesulfatator sp.]